MTDNLKFAVRMRIQYIAQVLAEKAKFSRRDLEEKFGISTCQASNDVRLFQSAYPGTMEYDTRAKVYRRICDISPAVPALDGVEGDGWLPISDAPPDEELLLAAWIVPSDEARRNGSRAHWVYGTGRLLYGAHWSGILSGNPTHFKYLTPPLVKE